MRAGRDAHHRRDLPGDYGAAELAGKAASFEITAKALQAPIVPRGRRRAGQEARLREPGRAARRRSREQIQREYDQLARLRLKRQLLDALAEQVDFAGARRAWSKAEFDQIWQRLEADRKAGHAGRRGRRQGRRDAEGRIPRHRRAAGAARPAAAEIGRANGIAVAPDEMTRAMRDRGGALSRPGAAGDGVLPQEPAARPRRCAARSSRTRWSTSSSNWRRSTDADGHARGTGARTRTRRRAGAARRGRPVGARLGAGVGRAGPGHRRRPDAAATARLCSVGCGMSAGSACRSGEVDDRHEGSRSGRDLRQQPGADGGRADRPRRARLRHLLPPAEGADHLPDRRRSTTRSAR